MSIADEVSAAVKAAGFDDETAAELVGMSLVAFRLFLTKRAPPPHPVFCEVDWIAGLLGRPRIDVANELCAELNAHNKRTKKKGSANVTER